jgi:hypothetical protein
VCYVMPSLVLDQRSCVGKLESFSCVFIFVCISLTSLASFCYFHIISFLSILSMHVSSVALHMC